METYVIILDLEQEAHLVTVQSLDSTTPHTYQVDNDLMERLFWLVKDSEEQEEPCVVLMNGHEFIL